MAVTSHDAVYVFIIRLKEISSKYESQEGQLSESNRSIIKTLRAEVAVKDEKIKTRDTRYKHVYLTLQHEVGVYVVLNSRDRY